jgi:acyl-coenzyme A synthetase/AMP-(fatty) acid ligase
VVAFTSGSTGAPEAHVKTLAQLFNETNTLITTFELGKRRVVAAVPPHHIYGLLFGVLVPWLGGGSVARTAPLLPGEVLSELKASNAEVLVAAPPHLRALAEHEACAWPRLHRVFSSTASLPEAADRLLADRGLSITQVLGSTETGGIGYRTSCSQPWRPLPSVELRVGSEGGLVVRSAWASAVAGEWTATADRVGLVDGGFVHLGRTDSVVKVGGHRVDLGSVEAALRDVLGVTDARALAVETASLRGVELWAVIEARGVTVDTLERALALRLHPVTMPRRYRVVAELPRAESGKVTREACLSLFDTWRFPREAQADGSVRIRLSPTSGYFRGHFEGNPMLPGVVQLTRIVLVECQRRWPELGPVVRMTRVKFKRPLTPGDELTLTLERQDHAQVCFAMSVAAQPATSGILHFRGAGP